MGAKLKILLLEDMPSDAELEARELKKLKLAFELKVVDNQKDYEAALDTFAPDIVLSDHLLPSFNSLMAFSILQEKGFDIPFILVTATVSEEFAVDMMNRGAADYILKDRLQRLPAAIENAVEKWRSKNDRENFLSEIIANEAMLNEAEKIAHVGSFRVDLASNEVKWSKESHRIFGYLYGHIQPTLQHLYQRIHPDDQQRIKESIEYAQKNRRMASLDFRLKMDDGEIKYLRSELVVERNEKGEAVNLHGFHQDVTESKQNEMLWLTLLKAIPDAVVNINGKGEIIFANKKAEDLFGYTTTEMIGHSVEMLVAEPLRAVLPELRQTYMAHPTPIHLVSNENRVINVLQKGGTLAEVDINLGPVETPNGTITIAILRDVTVVRRIERQIQVNERKFRALIEHNSDMTTLTSSDGKILYISPSFTKILGYTPEESLEKNSLDLVHPEDVEGMMTIIAQSNLNPGEAFYHKYRTKHKNGNYLWCEGTITDLLSDPDVGAIVSNFRDITERKNAEREKEKITADVIRQNKDLEQFAYIVSHNLRAPVANIKGLANSMQYANNENDKNFIINGIAKAVDKLDEIIIDLNDILNSTRANSEKRELVRFNDLVDNIRTSISDLIGKSDAEIETDFSEVSQMMTQKSYLLSIFFNLISNSIKYRQEEVEPLIRIKTKKEDNKLLILVEDNGIGIDMDKYGDQVFGLYKRFHNHIEGKGMGLFMVKTQVEALGGRISVKSELNKGTAFRIEFDEAHTKT